MSRLTSAQVIGLGEYLNPDFDPSTLTVSQLLGIFGFHNINYPSQYTKPKLVQLFNDEIKARSNKFKRERIKRENSQASDDGIKDGLTGKPLNEGRRALPTRRFSRRLSKAPSEEPESEPPRPEPSKRRRSSAEPSLGGPSRRKTAKPAEPVVIEESEPEEVAVRKVSRSKKNSADAGTQARRVSQTLASEDRDSGWEDKNIFQSGAESSSPARPSPVRPRTRRPSAIPTRSRKSMSAPPEYALASPTKGKEKEKLASKRAPSVKPPSSTFEPDLPPEVVRETKATIARTRRRSAAPEPPVERRIVVVPDSVEEEEPESQLVKAEDKLEDFQDRITIEVRPPTEIFSEFKAEEPEEEGVEETEYDADFDDVLKVSQRIAEGGQLVRKPAKQETSSASLALRVILAILALLAIGATYNYKQESAPIGFCETGKTTNEILEGMKARWAAIESCNQENRTQLFSQLEPDAIDSAVSPVPMQTASEPQGEADEGGHLIKAESCPPPALFPILRPSSCAPCPPHASCTPSTMTCETGYLLRPHPLLSFLSLPSSPSPATNQHAPNSYMLPLHSHAHNPSSDSLSQLIYTALAQTLDGLPGLGPVAFPPRCIEDPRRKRHIGVLGKAVEAMLAAERGRRLCAGVGVGEPVGTEAEEAKKWGVEVSALKEGMRRKTSPHLMDAFEDTFNEAIQQLVQWGGVFMGEDTEGKRYLAHHTPQMDWTCTIKVKSREAFNEWKKQIVGTLLLILSVMQFRHRQTQKVVEAERVTSLVQIALDLLRNQELAHHTDPITAPQAYLSSLQLRDLILQDEHSVSARKRLWERVERVVEGNANVRTNLEEVEGGDEMRVWRWVGSAGKTLSPGTGGVNTRAIQSEEQITG